MGDFEKGSAEALPTTIKMLRSAIVEEWSKIVTKKTCQKLYKVLRGRLWFKVKMIEYVFGTYYFLVKVS